MKNVKFLCRLGFIRGDTSDMFFAFFFLNSASLTYTREVIGLALYLVGITAHICIDITSSSFEYVINCIICEEDDISILEKICNFSYPIRIKTPFRSHL